MEMYRVKVYFDVEAPSGVQAVEEIESFVTQLLSAGEPLRSTSLRGWRMSRVPCLTPVADYDTSPPTVGRSNPSC